MTSETDIKVVAEVDAAVTELNRALAEAASRHNIQTDLDVVEVTGISSSVTEKRVLIRRMAKVIVPSKG